MAKQTIVSFIVGAAVGVAAMMIYSTLYPATVPGGSSYTTPPSSTTSTPGEGIGITFPLENFPITSPATVAGVVTVFENQFMISVLDANGKTLGETRAISYGDIGMPAAFVQEVTFRAATTPTGTIEIWDQSAKDGSKQLIDSVPVRFQ